MGVRRLVTIVEEHFHNHEYWFGSSLANGLGVLDRDSLDEFRITSGAGVAYGAPLQISDGTIPNGMVAKDWTGKMADFHRVILSNTEVNNKFYTIQLWVGTTNFAGAELVTEFMFAQPTNQFNRIPLDIICDRFNSSDKLWIRCRCENATVWIDFFLGAHFYPED